MHAGHESPVSVAGPSSSAGIEGSPYDRSMHYTLNESLPPLDRPVLVAALDGWVDAAGTYVGFRRELESDPDAKDGARQKCQTVMLHEELKPSLTQLLCPVETITAKTLKI